MDPHAEMMGRVRATCACAVAKLGVSGGRRAPIPGCGGPDRTVNPWELRPDRGVFKTEDILLANVKSQAKIPPNVVIESNFQELVQLGALPTAEELSLITHGPGNSTFHLTESQADIINKAAGPTKLTGGQLAAILDATTEPVRGVSKTPFELDRDSLAAALALRNIPLRGATTDGGTFDLVPEQVAAIMALTGSVGSSTICVRSAPIKHIAIYEPLPTSLGLPSFKWVVAPMGSGKTLMALFAGAYHAIHGWDACRQNVTTWARHCRSLGCVFPSGVRLTEKPYRPVRALFIVAGTTVFMQWLGVGDMLSPWTPCAKFLISGPNCNLNLREGCASGG